MKRLLISVIGGLALPLLINMIAVPFLFSGVEWLELIGKVIFLLVAGICLPLKFVFSSQDSLILAGIIGDFLIYSSLVYAFLRWRGIANPADEKLETLGLGK
jgi:hypothetical protein